MSHWTVSRLEGGSYKAVAGEDVIEQPLLKNHDYLTQKAFARAIMLKDPAASCEGLPEISNLLDRLRAEGFNQ